MAKQKINTTDDSEVIVVKVKEPKVKRVKVDKYALTVDEAIALLKTFKSKNKLRLHTFMGAGFALLGCDADLSNIKKELKATDTICLAGPNMRRMGHGVAFKDSKGGFVFLEADRDAIDAIHKKRGI